MNKQEVEQVAQYVNAYKNGQIDLSGEEIRQLKGMAEEAGIPMEIKTNVGRALGNMAFNFADTATLGILPDSWAPEALTGTEEFAGTLGSIGGMMLPMGGASQLGKLAGWGVGKIPQLSKLPNLANNLNILQGVARGATQGGLYNILEGKIDPLGMLLGGAGGGVMAKMGKFQAVPDGYDDAITSAMEKVKKMEEFNYIKEMFKSMSGTPNKPI